MKKIRDAAILYINGERHEVRGEAAFLMFADYLRYERGLVGTKIVCAEGDCGACTVLRASFRNGRISAFEAINSCIITVAQLDGSHLVTVEGLKQGTELSPVQTAMVSCHASQCGYCTPGFAMALTACLQKGKADEQSIKNALTGNLCRCTGYSPLIRAGLEADATRLVPLEERYITAASLKDLKAQSAIPLLLRAGDREFHAPAALDEALRLLRKIPDMRLVAAATDLGVQINKGKAQPTSFLSLHLISELAKIQKSKTRLRFGARVSLSEVRRASEESLPEFARFLNIFASPQIKNIGTLVGNIANASPIGDTLPFLMVADAVVHVVSARGKRDIPMAGLYSGYRSLTLKAAELIHSVSVRVPSAEEHLRIYKVSQRKDLDISAVNSAFLCRLKASASGPVIEDARIAYGGVAATVLRFPAVEAFLKGKALSHETIDTAAALIQREINPLSDVRGSAAYRRTVVDGLFRRYCEEVSSEVAP